VAQRNLSVKFNAEGYSETINRLKQTAKMFDEVLGKSQDAISKADAASQQALDEGDVEAYAKAQDQRVKATQKSNKIVVASYRELRIKSVSELEQMKRQAQAAYGAIAKSGSASAQDLVNAQIGLDQRLQKLDREINLQINVELDERAGSRFGAGVNRQLEQFSSGFVGDLKDSFKEIGKGNVAGGLLGAITSPARLIGTGLLEGLGFGLIQSFSRGLEKSIETKAKVNLSDLGLGLGSKVLDYDAGELKKDWQKFEDNLVSVLEDVFVFKTKFQPDQIRKEAEDFVADLIDQTVKAVAQPFRIRKRVKLAQSGLTAQDRAANINVPDDPNIKKAQSIAFVTGGIDFQKGDVLRTPPGRWSAHGQGGRRGKDSTDAPRSVDADGCGCGL
jgi:hypothetical protein